MESITPLASKCRVATPHDTVLNSECAFTFHSPYTSAGGIVVNLSTFVGTIDARAFQKDAPETSESALFVRIVKERVAKEVTTTAPMEEETDSATVTKLGIGVDGGFQAEDDKFETKCTHSVVLLEKKNGLTSVAIELPYNDDSKKEFPMQVASSVDSIIHHAGAAIQQDMKAWELDEEKPVSKYAASIEFVDNGIVISPNPSDWKCQSSGDNENIWLNLSDGYIGGGRKNWDGSGGSNGALDHFLQTGEKYPLVVKLGTITEDVDSADCYSYAKDEDGPVKIPNLAELLKKRGIMVAGMQKTVKSTAELEVELNASYAFDAITEAGASLVPVTGPSLQGLQNLGNSCYMNSVVQMLLSGTIPELASRYGTTPNGDVTSNSLLNVAPTDASTDLLCQTAKLSSALTSGTFAGPLPESAVVSDESTLTASNDPKYRLPPRMFKHLIGRDHVDFCTNQQQDAAQFLQYLFEKLDRAEMAAAKRGRLTNKVNGSTEEGVVGRSSNLFAFQSETRLVCQEDQKIKYTENAPETVLSLRIPMEEAVKGSGDEDSEPEEKKHKSENKDGDEKMEEDVPTVLFKSCIDSWASSQEIDGLRWPHLNNKVSVATGENRFSNFPRFLLFQMRRYELGADWTPKKIEVNIDMPDEIDLSDLRASGPQSGESLVPEEDESNATTPSSAPVIDESALGQLMDMGFNMNGCKRALNAVGGSDMESAMNWIFEHSSDPDFNDPMTEKGAETAASSGPDVDEATVSSLVANLGCFTSDQVRAALKECGGAADRAADWLFSHMDDLDGAITKLQSNSTTGDVVGSTTPSSKSLEDGNGKYKLIGLVSHIGKNTESGHYVAHLKKEGKWVIFNDEKVALSEKPPIQHAYLYLFQRVDSIGSPNMSY